MEPWVRKDNLIMNYANVTHSCTDENNYIIRSCFIPIQILLHRGYSFICPCKLLSAQIKGKWHWLSWRRLYGVLRLHWSLYGFIIHSEQSLYSSAVLVFHILMANQKGLQSRTILKLRSCSFSDIGRDAGELRFV